MKVGGSAPHCTAKGPWSHGRSRLSKFVESGQGISILKVPSVLASCTLYPSRLIVHPLVAIWPMKGDVVPVASMPTLTDVGASPIHSKISVALVVVPRAGACTKYSAWSKEPTLPPTRSNVTTASPPEHLRRQGNLSAVSACEWLHGLEVERLLAYSRETLYAKRHFFST